jgi:hypothetical protein
MVTLKSCNLISRSKILEQVQLDVREVTSLFLLRLEGVACETNIDLPGEHNAVQLNHSVQALHDHFEGAHDF